MTDLLHDVLFDYTLRNVALGAAIIGFVAGALGTFAVLRRQSLLGDTISHAALPGIGLAFLLSGAKIPLWLLLGAAVTGWLGTWFILNILRRTKIKEDAAQGIVLSVFFGLGLVLLTWIQRIPTASVAGLDKYIFGQAATLMTEDILTMSLLGALCLTLLGLFWKEFKLLAFDRDFGAAQGFPMRGLEILLTSLIVVAIVIGLQTVGVILMSAMLVAPAASARQWTDKLESMTLGSALIGAVSGAAGALISSAENHLPTGPTIVILLTAVSVFSLLFGARRGLFWKLVQRLKNRRIFAAEKLLHQLHQLSRPHGDVFYGHAFALLLPLYPPSEQPGLRFGLKILCERGLVHKLPGDRWALTEAGLRHVEGQS